MSPNTTRCKVAVIGAGLAGLEAARTLINATCEDVIILEAQNDPGGRIKTIPFQEGVIDLGAQWIHDTDNPLYSFASERGLLSSETSQEGQGVFIRDDGRVLDEDLVKQVDFEVGRILQHCERFVDVDDYPRSVGEFLEEKFLDWIEFDDAETRKMKLELLDWHNRFQVIDNSCPDLMELSAKEWGRYMCSEIDGQTHVNLENGYQSLVNALIQDLPNDILKCNTPVTKIAWKNGIKISSSNGTTTICDHVIVTVPLGVLKCSRLFDPPLPSILNEAIARMGYFGGIAKIFLVFSHRWWDVEGFQLVWSKDADPSKEESWTRDVTGFDNVLNHPNVLVGWVGGKGAYVMENLPEEVIGEHCVNLLRRFLKRNNISYPVKVFRSRWTSSPWIRGGYSCTTPHCDEKGLGPETLCQPVFEEDVPRIFLAGEACSLHHFATTHGAFESGQSQARALLKLIH